MSPIIYRALKNSKGGVMGERTVSEVERELLLRMQYLKEKWKELVDTMHQIEKKTENLEDVMLKHITYHDTIEKQKHNNYRLYDLVQTTLIIILMVLQLT